MNPEIALGKYDTSGIAELKEIDSTRGENDYRKTYLVKYSSGKQLAVKVASNSFTTPERIKGWHELIEKYNNAGIYTPRIVTGLDGKLSYQVSEEGVQYTVFAEEIKKYKCADEIEPPLKIEEYEEDLFRMIGKIASLPAIKYGWNSAYCLYDKFCKEDLTDENYECARDWCNMFREAAPERVETIDQIWNIYSQIRSEFEPEYRRLPRTAFQADLNTSNIMFDDNRRFVGLIDFNLAGTETILNYVLCESFFGPAEEEELKVLTAPEYISEHDNRMKRRIGYVAQYYSFTEAEKAAFPKLYQMVVPFRWPAFGCFRYAVKENKKEYYDNIINWVYHQITRDDIKL